MCLYTYSFNIRYNTHTHTHTHTHTGPGGGVPVRTLSGTELSPPDGASVTKTIFEFEGKGHTTLMHRYHQVSSRILTYPYETTLMHRCRQVSSRMLTYADVC